MYPGQPIRFPVENKGRFEPAAKENLLRTLTIDTPHLGPDEHATD